MLNLCLFVWQLIPHILCFIRHFHFSVLFLSLLKSEMVTFRLWWQDTFSLASMFCFYLYLAGVVTFRLWWKDTISLASVFCFYLYLLGMVTFRLWWQAISPYWVLYIWWLSLIYNNSGQGTMTTESESAQDH